ncbi:MAG: NYN domain-containing protein [Hyphomicrobiales bacterium]|nr:NYN domain-containing protein [Hyphomicrobiales bacterium]
MSNSRLIVGVDAQFVRAVLKKRGAEPRVPYREFVDFLEEKNNEVLEIFAPAIRLPAQPRNPGDPVHSDNEKFYNYRAALELQGVNVIEAPAKWSGTFLKHSDDQRLMIRLALTCMRLKPDFLVLVAADGDYAPLVWGLREEGIRTKLITDTTGVARELRAAAYSISDIFNILQQLGVAEETDSADYPQDFDAES